MGRARPKPPARSGRCKQLKTGVEPFSRSHILPPSELPPLHGSFILFTYHWPIQPQGAANFFHA